MRRWLVAALVAGIVLWAVAFLVLYATRSSKGDSSSNDAQGGDRHPPIADTKEGPAGPVDAKAAERIARRELGKFNPKCRYSRVDVQRIGDLYVITFPIERKDIWYDVGSSNYGQVTIDARTGKVVQILGPDA